MDQGTPETTSPPAMEASAPSEGGDIKDRIVAALKTCYDPEIPVDIYELGLIYNIEVGDDGVALVRMTLTAPNCPAAESLPAEVANKVKGIDGIADCKIELVWDPPWNMGLMTEAARLQLGMD